MAASQHSVRILVVVAVALLGGAFLLSVTDNGGGGGGGVVRTGVANNNAYTNLARHASAMYNYNNDASASSQPRDEFLVPAGALDKALMPGVARVAKTAHDPSFSRDPVKWLRKSGVAIEYTPNEIEELQLRRKQGLATSDEVAWLDAEKRKADKRANKATAAAAAKTDQTAALAATDSGDSGAESGGDDTSGDAESGDTSSVAAPFVPKLPDADILASGNATHFEYFKRFWSRDEHTVKEGVIRPRTNKGERVPLLRTIPTSAAALPRCSVRDAEMRGDKVTMPGAWVQHATDVDDSRMAYTMSCPFMMREYACYDFGRDKKAQAQQVAYRSFHPHRCRLDEFDSQDFLRCNRNRRLLFIGDSTTRQFYISLACQLGAGVRGGWVTNDEGHQRANRAGRERLPAYYEYNVDAVWPRFVRAGNRTEFPHHQEETEAKREFYRPGARSKKEPESYMCDDPWFHGGCWYPSSHAYFPERNVGVDFHFFAKWDVKKFEKLFRSGFHKLMKGDASLRAGMAPRSKVVSNRSKPKLYPIFRPYDVLVFNVGVHYHGNLDLYVTDLAAFIVYLSEKFPKTGQVFLRQYSPSHHVSELDGGNGGEFRKGSAPPLKRKDCSPIKWFLESFREATAAMLRRCREGEELQPGVTASGRCSNMHILPVADASQPSFDAHFGSFGAKPGALKIADCTHWCLPGVPDVWTQMLHTFLGNDCPAD
jgi:hypothetical protein